VTATETWIALVGALFGGVGLKVAEAILGRRKSRDDLASSLRTELRTDISSLRIENEHLRHEVEHLEETVDEWRDKYYSLIIEQSKLRK
jgi:predicted nuclease with TOPRIM domain